MSRGIEPLSAIDYISISLSMRTSRQNLMRNRKMMRAKMVVESVEPFGDSERLTMRAVCRNDAYPQDGSDEDNTFAQFTPSASLEMCVNNPNLVGKVKTGQKFYVDFTAVEE